MIVSKIKTSPIAEFLIADIQRYIVFRAITSNVNERPGSFICSRLADGVITDINIGAGRLGRFIPGPLKSNTTTPSRCSV